jgi:hypothetical protein
MLGLTGLTTEYVARGLESGAGCIVVTTDRTVGSVASSLAEHTSSSAFRRLGVVDATGQEPDPDSVPCRVESVSSPADLTGIGIGLSKLLETLYADDVPEFRVTVDSISSLLVYAGFDRVYQFLHTVRTRVDDLDGSSVFLLSADTDRDQVAKFETLFDGRIEVREAGDAPEYRIRGAVGSDDWRVLPGDDSWSDAADVTGGDEAAGAVLDSPASIHEMIETVEAAGLTLTLCNYDGDDDLATALRSYFGRHNVDVRTATLSTETPANVALLHRGRESLAASDVSALATAVGDGDDDSPSAGARPAVIDHVHRNEYAVADGTKLELVRISRLMESRALGTGRGTLHAGFQDVSRVDDDLGTRRLYERIAGSDVDVHLYGRPGEVPRESYDALHTAETGELVDSWFVVYDGGGRNARKGALVCEETAPGRYTGFWSYQPSLVDAVTGYLERTYVSA